MWLILFVVPALSWDLHKFHEILNNSQCNSIISTGVFDDNTVYSAYNGGLREYAKNFDGYPFNITQDSGYKLIMLDETNSTRIRIPSYGTLTGIILLTDRVAGGELVFPRQNQEISQKCGDLVMFPSYFGYPYRFKEIRLGKVWFLITFFW